MKNSPLDKPVNLWYNNSTKRKGNNYYEKLFVLR